MLPRARENGCFLNGGAEGALPEGKTDGPPLSCAGVSRRPNSAVEVVGDGLPSSVPGRAAEGEAYAATGRSRPLLPCARGESSPRKGRVKSVQGTGEEVGCTFRWAPFPVFCGGGEEAAPLPACPSPLLCREQERKRWTPPPPAAGRLFSPSARGWGWGLGHKGRCCPLADCFPPFIRGAVGRGLPSAPLKILLFRHMGIESGCDGGRLLTGRWFLFFVWRKGRRGNCALCNGKSFPLHGQRERKRCPRRDTALSLLHTGRKRR